MENKKLLLKLVEIVELFELLNKSNFQDMYDGLNINEVHAIDFIGRNINPKLTDISNFLNVTRGGATKITKRLIDESHIQCYQLPENKKEKYFKLTNTGKEIFEKHKLIHDESIEKDSKIFDELSKEEKEIVFKFLGILENDLIIKLKSN
ncbi:MAG: MarR family transcriptional regulator [Peptostreptococcaceae bacterium]